MCIVMGTNCIILEYKRVISSPDRSCHQWSWSPMHRRTDACARAASEQERSWAGWKESCELSKILPVRESRGLLAYVIQPLRARVIETGNALNTVPNFPVFPIKNLSSLLFSAIFSLRVIIAYGDHCLISFFTNSWLVIERLFLFRLRLLPRIFRHCNAVEQMWVRRRSTLHPFSATLFVSHPIELFQTNPSFSQPIVSQRCQISLFFLLWLPPSLNNYSRRFVRMINPLII